MEKGHDQEILLHHAKPLHRVRPGLDPVPGKIEFGDFLLAKPREAIFLEQIQQLDPVNLLGGDILHCAAGNLDQRSHIAVDTPFIDELAPGYIDPGSGGDRRALFHHRAAPVGNSTEHIKTQCFYLGFGHCYSP